MTMDPVQTEIMKNRFTAMAEEAATLAYRTAHTTFVKQTQDFQVAVANLEGYFFAYPMLTGVVTGSGQTIAGLLKHFPPESLAPGDVLISNDPFATEGVVTHMMDIHMARPIFVDGRLECFAWSFIHASDIGGAVPGSISPDLFECFQEGLRLRPIKVVTAGVLNRDIVDILRDNSRIGDAIWGDLEAMMAAMRLLDRRVNELCQRVGTDVFRKGVTDVMDYAEMKARRVISTLIDGDYEFSDYVEGDDAGAAVHIHCKLSIRGDEAEISYAGSSPQVHAAFNFATGNRTHPFLCLALTHYIQTMEPDIPINGGVIRPIRASAPLGTVMNATFPAAMGNRFVAVMRTYDTLMGCLNQAIPNGVAACGAGQAGIISFSWNARQDGKRCVAVVQPFSGGSGGRIRSDGVDASDTMIGVLKSTPVEHVESEMPLVIRRHELVPDSFGHGKHRGGAAVKIELENLASEATMTVRGLDRFRFQPWGVFGGSPGTSCHTEVETPGEGMRKIGRIKVLNLRQGEILHMKSSSGGGFGNPRSRNPRHVLRDVADGLLDAGKAASVYGVAIKDGCVDEIETEHLRQGSGIPEGRFSVIHGSARVAYEQSWPEEASSLFAVMTLEVEPGMRRHVSGKALQALQGSRRISLEHIKEAFRAARSQTRS